jgi:membrane protease YdiL (CAAX protease family)
MVVFRVVDTGLYRATRTTLPRLALAADLRLSSLALVCLLVLATRARARLRALTVAPGDLGRFGRVVGAWLFGCWGTVHFTGIGRIPLPRWQDVAAFAGTGPLAEELLVRGLVLDAALGVWPARGRGPGRGAYVSAAVFALMHLQYHAFRVDTASLSQLAWTFPLGVILGWLGERTKSLWLAAATHAVNNAIVLLA